MLLVGDHIFKDKLGGNINFKHFLGRTYKAGKVKPFALQDSKREDCIGNICWRLL